jgi:hypothetical protein
VTLPLSAMTGVMNAAIKALAAHVRRIEFSIMLPSYISLRLKLALSSRCIHLMEISKGIKPESPEYWAYLKPSFLSVCSNSIKMFWKEAEDKSQRLGRGNGVVHHDQ